MFGGGCTRTLVAICDSMKGWVAVTIATTTALGLYELREAVFGFIIKLEMASTSVYLLVTVDLVVYDPRTMICRHSRIALRAP